MCITIYIRTVGPNIKSTFCIPIFRISLLQDVVKIANYLS